MNLSLKALRFVIEALELSEQEQDRRMQQEGLSEDDLSDLINDRQYLEAIKQDFARHQDELLHKRESRKVDVE